jgi:hypothetical protein
VPNPTGLLLAPLALMVMVYGGRKNKKSAPYVLMLVMLVVLPLSVGLACEGSAPTPTPAPTDTPNPPTDGNGQVGGAGTVATDTAVVPTATPTPTVTAPPPCCNWLDKPFLITHYVISLESDTLFDGCWNCWTEPANIPMSESPGGAINYNHSYKNAFVYGRCDTEAQCKADPPQAYWGVYQEGTGYTLDGRYIMQDGNQLTDKGKAVFTFVDEPKAACASQGYFLEVGKTVATSEDNLWARGGRDDSFTCGKKYYIEGFEGVFTIVDSGTGVDDAQFDIYVGKTTKAAFDATYTNTDTEHRVAPAP